MRILFSPVGNSDPITWTGEGPMLHIVRHMRPDKVVLFFSPYTAQWEHKDGRYTESIRLLCEGEDRRPPEVEIVESDYPNPHHFDHYINEFAKVIEGIAESDPGATILANATSGTPSMQSAVLTLGTFGRPPLRILQVASPRRGPNTPKDRIDPAAYSKDEMWEWNESLRSDDPSALECRVSEVEVPNYTDRILRENTIRLVEAYDYVAAYEMARQIHNIKPHVLRMIGAARDRLDMESVPSDGVFRRRELAYRADDLLGEYLSVMEVRYAQGHWADLVRMLTPALTHLAIDILRRCGLSEQLYLVIDDEGKPTSAINWTRVEDDRQLAADLGATRANRSQYIGNGQLVKLVVTYCNEQATKLKFIALRNVEVNCRHMLAHGLAASSRETLEREGGLQLDAMVQYLFDLHGSARRHLYRDINSVIVDAL